MDLPTRVRFALTGPFLLFFIISGCENIALFPRPNIDRIPDRSQTDLPRDLQGSDPSHGEMIGTVERVDPARQEIYVRTSQGRTMVVRYDPQTGVFNGNRQLAASALRPGDLVRVQSTRSLDGEYADVIRTESLESWY
jgi:hypothetical protein